jgi:hypothetical protein
MFRTIFVASTFSWTLRMSAIRGELDHSRWLRLTTVVKDMVVRRSFSEGGARRAENSRFGRD